ncbi:MAG: hemolysin family protein [Alphaproteobacteria bacterium]
MAEITPIGREADETGQTSGETADHPPSMLRRFVSVFSRGRGDGNGLRDSIEDLIEEAGEDAPEIDDDERELIANILRLRDQRAYDAMIPRVDIIAMPLEATREDLFRTINEHPHSRFPVFRENLDDIVGVLHIKDILGAIGRDEEIVIGSLVRDVLIVSPAMRAADLLLEMRQKRQHMAVVIDEFGGTDGLLTIEDLVEEIVGEIEDEHDREESVQLVHKADGSILADARLDIEDFEEELGRSVLNEEQREDIDTLGGYVADLAGEVPPAGTVLSDSEAAVDIEIIEADPRRIRRIRVRDRFDGQVEDDASTEDTTIVVQ